MTRRRPAPRLDLETAGSYLGMALLLVAAISIVFSPTINARADRIQARTALEVERAARVERETATVRLVFWASVAVVAPVVVGVVVVCVAMVLGALARNFLQTPASLPDRAFIRGEMLIDPRSHAVTALSQAHAPDATQAQALAQLVEAHALTAQARRREWFNMAGRCVEFAVLANQHRDALPVEILEALPMEVEL